MYKSNPKKLAIGVVLLASGMTATPINANPQSESVVSYFDSSWTIFASDEEGATPGSGGQDFDAEYLLYKIEGSLLYLGLQSGFDLIDGHQYYNTWSQDHYWAGDLALSFDGDVISTPADPLSVANSYEFGIDFGLYTADYSSNPVDAVLGSSDGLGAGRDTAGVYSVAAGGWSTNLVDSYEDDSSPFAMNQHWDGTGTDPYLSSLILNDAGYEDESFYRAVAFDLRDLGLELSNLSMDAHWTMSCGNDNINGSQEISVPEPGVLFLLASGLLGLVGIRRFKWAA
jgi:hypothetical protein